MRWFLMVLVLGAMGLAEAEVKTEQVDYKAGDVTLKGYLAYDDAIIGKRPGVIVVHEWWGHNAYARKRAEMLAQMGYTALAVDMYGDGKTADHPDDASQFMNETIKDPKVAHARFAAGMAVLTNHETTDAEKTAAIGYCFGGAVVLSMAQSGVDLDGVVSFHGSLVTVPTAKVGGVSAKVLVCHGADDPLIPVAQVSAFKTHMDSLKADYKFIAYEGVVHSFTNPEADEFAKKFNLPVAYDEETDKKSWAEMQTFFNQIFEQDGKE